MSRSSPTDGRPAARAVASGSGALAFAERVLLLLDSGRTSATYKLATLLALMDVVAERSDAKTGAAPQIVSARDVGRRVIELYWQQSVPYTIHAGEPVPLVQSKQNDIPAKLHDWRRRHNLDTTATLDDAAAADPRQWPRRYNNLVATVLLMPIPRLQRFGDGQFAVEDRFIYDYGWTENTAEGAVTRPDFDDRLFLRPNVGEHLVRMVPLLRPAVQSKWAALVARNNKTLVDRGHLDDFLFGTTRIDLGPARRPLLAAQRGRCFYCDRVVRDPHVDHFVPWSRHPDDSLDNLVVAHAECNGAKSASIAGHAHLEAWVHRLHDPVVDQIAADIAWPRRRDRTVGIAGATYFWLPTGSRLWVRSREFEVIDPQQVRQLLSAA
jgi:5-methylcytosine-specific restriction endonuclease McrA